MSGENMTQPAGMMDAFAAGELESLSVAFHMSSGEAAQLESWLQEFDTGWPDRSFFLFDADPIGADELITTQLWLSSCDLDDVDDYVLVMVDWATEAVLRNGLSEIQQAEVDGLGKVTNILGTVAKLVGSGTFRCTSSYLLDRSNWEPVIALPLMRINIPGTSLQQISGVRFSAGRPAVHHSATLEIMDNDTLKVILEFVSKGGGPPEGFFDAVLPDSDRMRNCIVTHED